MRAKVSAKDAWPSTSRVSESASSETKPLSCSSGLIGTMTQPVFAAAQ
ncbi:MAG: hypothetical protein U1E35_05015 [Rhodospirillales bacterium]